MAKPVILFISPIRLWPTLQGDRICSLEYAKLLSCFGSLHLLSLAKDCGSRLDHESPFDSEAHIPLEHPSNLTLWALMLMQRRQPAFVRFRRKNIVRQIIEHAQRIEASHVHFEISTLAEVAVEVKKTTNLNTSIRLLNVESLSLGRVDRASATSPLRRILFPILAPLVNGPSFRAEMAALRRLKRIQVISAGDCAVLAANGITSVKIGPPFPDLPRQLISDDLSQGLRIVFIGGISQSSTGGGLREFLEHVFPLGHIQKAGEAAEKLTIVGPDNDPTLEPWEKHPSVTFAGFASDSSAFRAQAHLMLASLREPRGIRVKIIDALSRGMPVLAAEEALYGFDQSVKAVVFWYREIEEVDRIFRSIHENVDSLREMGLAGRAYYEKHFSPAQCRTQLAAFHAFNDHDCDL